MVDVFRQHIEIVQGAGGPKTRIAGSRIRVMDVVTWYEQQGMSAVEIGAEFPSIALADVHAALAYYWDNRDEIEGYMERERAYVEEARSRITSPLAEKLQRLRVN